MARKPKVFLTVEQIIDAHQRHADGEKYQTLAQEYGCTTKTVANQVRLVEKCVRGAHLPRKTHKRLREAVAILRQKYRKSVEILKETVEQAREPKPRVCEVPKKEVLELDAAKAMAKNMIDMFAASNFQMQMEYGKDAKGVFTQKLTIVFEDLSLSQLAQALGK